MSDRNVKIVKVDPLNFFIKKDEDGKESIGSTTDISDESSITSISSTGGSVNENNLNHLPVNPNVSVIKEEVAVREIPSDSVVQINDQIDAAQANNYLSTKPAFEPPKLVNNVPFINNTSKVESEIIEESDSKTNTITDSETDTDTETASKTTESSGDEVIDMTDNTLYTVLAALFEDDETGNNVSENLASIDRKLEKHNEMMEKMLAEYTQMNRERSKDRRNNEQLVQAINNQNRMLEKMVSVFEVFLKTSGKVQNKVENDDNKDTIVGGKDRRSRVADLGLDEKSDLYHKMKKGERKSDRVSVSKEERVNVSKEDR